MARLARSHTAVVGILLLLFSLLSLLFISVPSQTFLWKSVYNFGHVPLFGLVAILVLWISRVLSHRSGWASILHYGIALVGVLVLALLTEALQSLNVSRHTSPSDVFHDLLGAICGLGVFLTYDSHLLGHWVRWRKFPRNVVIRLCVVVILCIALLPVLEWAYAYWDRATRFPTLLDFSSSREMKFVRAIDSELEVVPPPEYWKNSTKDLVGRVIFHPKKYPGIYLEEPYPDWREYTNFQLDIYSKLPTSQTITLRIDDLLYGNAYAEGFNRRLVISPGLNHIEVAIEDIRQAPVGREMDLSSIRKVMLFAVNPPGKFTLYFDSIRLE